MYRWGVFLNNKMYFILTHFANAILKICLGETLIDSLLAM